MRDEEHPEEEPTESYAEAVRRGIPYRDKDGLIHYPTVSSRPHPDFDLDIFHRILLIASLAVAMSYTVWIGFRIPSMPEQIPLHFGLDGSVNRYGSPVEILIPAGIMLTSIIGCAVLTRYPRIFNYGLGTPNEKNIQAHYKNGMQLMTWLTFSLTFTHIAILGGLFGDWPIDPAI